MLVDDGVPFLEGRDLSEESIIHNLVVVDKDGNKSEESFDLENDAPAPTLFIER